MNNILNFRALGNGKTNYVNKSIKNIFRSADVSYATEEDAQVLKDLGIKNIIDLRSEMEIKNSQLLSDNEIKIVNIDIIGDGNQNDMSNFLNIDLREYMLDLYRTKFVETEGFKEEIEFILSLEGKPFLFHCTAGKDRTGITGVIIMTILGFTKQQIIDEYLEIDPLLLKSIEKKFFEILNGLSEDKQNDLKEISTVKTEYIEAFFEGVEEKYGSMENYIMEKLEITDTEKAILEKYYLN